jgi:hypothetical protein
MGLPIRLWRLLVSILLGGSVASAVFVGTVYNAQVPIWFLLTRTEGITLAANVLWYVGFPHLLAACVGTGVGQGFGQVRNRSFLGAVAVGTLTGSLLSYFIWTRVTIGMQGLNPIFFAGFIVAAFVGPVAAAMLESLRAE